MNVHLFLPSLVVVGVALCPVHYVSASGSVGNDVSECVDADGAAVCSPCGLCGTSGADDFAYENTDIPPIPPPERLTTPITDSRVVDLIALLGDDSYDTREAAEAELARRLRNDDVAAVRVIELEIFDHVQDPDAEIKRRIGELVRLTEVTSWTDVLINARELLKTDAMLVAFWNDEAVYLNEMRSRRKALESLFNLLTQLRTLLFLLEMPEESDPEVSQLKATFAGILREALAAIGAVRMSVDNDGMHAFYTYNDKVYHRLLSPQGNFPSTRYGEAFGNGQLATLRSDQVGSLFSPAQRARYFPQGDFSLPLTVEVKWLFSRLLDSWDSRAEMRLTMAPISGAIVDYLQARACEDIPELRVARAAVDAANPNFSELIVVQGSLE